MIDLCNFAKYLLIVAKRKKTNSASNILVYVILLPAIAMAAYYGFLYLNKPKFVHYSGFGIDLPVNFAIHGIDVSRHQAKIDWDDVKTMQVKDIKIGFWFYKSNRRGRK